MIWTQWLLWQARTPQSGWQKLDAPHRSAALSALLGLVLLGFLMIFLVWLAGRFFRRHLEQPSGLPFGPSKTSLEDWAEKTLNDSTGDDE